jgi:hypothetical protein
MDLIGQEEKQPSGKGKKIVIASLIVSVTVLIFMIIIMISLMGTPQNTTFRVLIDNEILELKEGVIIEDENGKMYISLRAIANRIENFRYLNGIYGEATEDPFFAYLENQYEIVGFETDSNIIYKTTPNSNRESRSQQLSSKIINIENNLYIYVNDLVVACNVVVEDEDNELKIYTSTFLAEHFGELIDEEDSNNIVSSDYANRKAMAYNMIVVSKNGRFGVIDFNLREIIGIKYRNLTFNEHETGESVGTFIATSNENRVGVIDTRGEEIIPLIYDDIKVLNYHPMLYEVKRLNKFGVIDESGKTLVEPIYDSLGYRAPNNNEGRESVMFIPRVIGNEDGIVVVRANKYGIVNIRTGEEIFRR